jgi:hypothetical protein
MTQLRHAAALLTITSLLGAAGCGESDTPAKSGKAEGKVTSTPTAKQPAPNGY